MSSSKFEIQVGSKSLSIETGTLAQQANGSVLVRYGDSVALVTATMGNVRDGIDFFPLTVDFEERLYARGKIPGSFFRREGRPSTEGVLSARMIDRPIRPLFPLGLRNEVQIIVTPLSVDLENPIDIPAIIGASASLVISDIPFAGPIGATRIGFLDDDYVVNPTYEQIEKGSLDLVVVGSQEGVIMIEAGANELPEETVLEGIMLAQEVNVELIDLQTQMVNTVGKPKIEIPTNSGLGEIESQVVKIAGERLPMALEPASSKSDQADQLDALKSDIVEKLGESYDDGDISDAFSSLVEKEFRKKILDHGARPDGRGPKDIRDLACEVNILPRTHGSALFSRGETQVLGVATLGSVGDSQKLDNLSPIDSKRFMLHYNFPPYSVGETRMVGSPKRRDIGHGALAEKALSPVIPNEEEFPYAIRLVAEVLGSNGSTSMGSACACSLAMMDAGIPIKSPVAGISIGLITGDNGKFAILTDIQGMEDHFGDMDFKVAGTVNGITAIQLDIKVQNIGYEIVRSALSQAKEARLVILDRMRQTIESPRVEMSPYAPRMTRITVPVDKIGAVIGPGGKTIRGIIEETETTVDVQNDGTVTIGAADQSAAQKAIDIIKGLTKEVKVGDIFTGKVVRILNFGAFVEIMPGVDGMVHISELADRRVPSVEDVVKIGESIKVVVIGVEQGSGKISLSRRALSEKERDNAEGGDDNRQTDPKRSDGRPRANNR